MVSEEALKGGDGIMGASDYNRILLFTNYFKTETGLTPLTRILHKLH